DDAGFGQPHLQTLAIEMGKPLRHRERADVDQRRDRVRLQDGGEFGQFTRGVTDGVNGDSGGQMLLRTVVSSAICDWTTVRRSMSTRPSSTRTITGGSAARRRAWSPSAE